MGVTAVGAVGGTGPGRLQVSAVPALPAVDGRDDPTGTPDGGSAAKGTGTAGREADAGAPRPATSEGAVQPEEHSAAADATQSYLQELYLARAFGTRVEVGDRPAEIAPDRLSGLVDYLQDQVELSRASTPGSVFDVDA